MALSALAIATQGLAPPRVTRLVAVQGLWPAGIDNRSGAYVPGLIVGRPRAEVSTDNRARLLREDDDLLAVLMAFVQTEGMGH